MIRPRTVRVALLAATALVVGAPALATAVAAPPPNSQIVTPADTGETVTLAKGETLVVSLTDNNPSTGYVWLFGSPLNTAILKIVSDTTTPPAPIDPPTTGAAEPRTMILRAIKAGTTKLNLIYVRPDAPSDPASTLAVTVKVRDLGAPCATKGLRSSRKQGTATFSVAVQTLRAKATNCTRARAIARVAARRLLTNRAVPTKIGGFKVVTQKPCGGCSPIWTVTATRGKARVTFELAGGR